MEDNPLSLPPWMGAGRWDQDQDPITEKTWDHQVTLIAAPVYKGWALSGPTPAWVHMSACLRKACLQPCRHLIKVSVFPTSGLWWMVEGEISEKGHEVKSSLWALVVLLKPASCPTPTFWLPGGKTDEKGQAPCTHVYNSEGRESTTPI